MKTTQVLLTLLIGFVLLGVGFAAGRLTAPGMGILAGSSGMTPAGTMNQATQSNNESSAAAAQVEDSVTISTASMTTEQQAALKKLGVEGDEIVITPTMIACAEAKIGTARVDEIMNGATPSFTEGVALMACYSQ